MCSSSSGVQRVRPALFCSLVDSAVSVLVSMALPASSGWARIRSSLACRSEEHTSELQSQSNLVCRLLLEKKKKKTTRYEESEMTHMTSDSIHAVQDDECRT